MSLIGRTKELETLNHCTTTGRPEFVAVYGRRRVGKTYLVREYFENSFSFYATGVENQNMSVQLRTFAIALRDYGSSKAANPKDWFDAFVMLRDLMEADNVIRDRVSRRRVIFLDELPWFDTPRSNFKTALEWFWNSWASAQNDIMLIVCGSATSWILDNLINSTGGFYNRVTRQIHLLPLTLGECEDLLSSNGIVFTRRQVTESYMVFGGIPYYFNLMSRRLSLAQNIETLCFDGTGELRFERQLLFRSLFRHSDLHESIVEALSHRSIGLSRAELAKAIETDPGKGLSKALSELEQCGFIRKYLNYSKKKNGHLYQLIDPFTIFSLRFLEDDGPSSWMEYLNSPGYRAWSGLAFELVCLLHVRQIKQALGIAGVSTRESAWHSMRSEPGAQIDLLIDRADGVINLCEMKFCEGEFVIDAAYERTLRTKLETFSREASPGKALHTTMVTMDGVAFNAYKNVVTSEIRADDLFTS